MDQDDPEKRIADLERQLAEQKRFWRDAGSGTQRPWPKQEGADQGRDGGRLAAVGPFLFAALWTIAFTDHNPWSAVWMNGIVCSSGYHLAYDTRYVTGPSGPDIITDFQCVNGAGSYVVDDLVIKGLQFLLALLVLYVAVAVGVLMWRRLRRPRCPLYGRSSREGIKRW
jgi:hypothetical protein